MKKSFRWVKKYPEDVMAASRRLANCLFTGDSFEVVEVVAGEKCNNGGEYGFYSAFTKTSVPGVYYWSRRTTSEFDCGTGPQGYVVLTDNMVERIVAESKKNYGFCGENVVQLSLGRWGLPPVYW